MYVCVCVGVCMCVCACVYSLLGTGILEHHCEDIPHLEIPQRLHAPRCALRNRTHTVRWGLGYRTLNVARARATPPSAGVKKGQLPYLPSPLEDTNYRTSLQPEAIFCFSRFKKTTRVKRAVWSTNRILRRCQMTVYRRRPHGHWQPASVCKAARRRRSCHHAVCVQKLNASPLFPVYPQNQDVCLQHEGLASTRSPAATSCSSPNIFVVEVLRGANEHFKQWQGHHFLWAVRIRSNVWVLSSRERLQMYSRVTLHATIARSLLSPSQNEAQWSGVRAPTGDCAFLARK